MWGGGQQCPQVSPAPFRAVFSRCGAGTALSSVSLCVTPQPCHCGGTMGVQPLHCGWSLHVTLCHLTRGVLALISHLVSSHPALTAPCEGSCPLCHCLCHPMSPVQGAGAAGAAGTRSPVSLHAVTRCTRASRTVSSAGTVTRHSPLSPLCHSPVTSSHRGHMQGDVMASGELTPPSRVPCDVTHCGL